jgi:hypothetical protein
LEPSVLSARTYSGSVLALPSRAWRSLTCLMVNTTDEAFVPIIIVQALSPRTGGPLKPDFGLSGTVRRLDRVFPALVHVFVPSIPTRSPPVSHSQSRSGENCSTPSPPDVRTTQPSPDCDEYIAQLFHKLRVISNVEIVVPLLPEMLRIANRGPRRARISLAGVEANAALLLASTTSAHRPAYPVAVR